MEVENALKLLPSSYRNITLLNEVYYGKNPLLLELEKEIDLLYEEFFKGKIMLDSSDHTLRMREILKELFGFTDVAIKFMLTDHDVKYKLKTSAVNIFKVKESINMIKSGGDNLEKGPYGVRYKSGCGISVILFIDIDDFIELTAGELVSEILYQVGKNFHHKSLFGVLYAYTTLFYIFKTFEFESNVKNTLKSMIFANTDDLIVSLYNKLMEKINKIDSPILNYIIPIGQVCGEIYSYIKTHNLFEYLNSRLNAGFIKFLNLGFFMKRYEYWAFIFAKNKVEKFAYHFVASYGYAVEHASVLKYNNSLKSNVKLPIDNKIIENGANLFLLLFNISILPIHITDYIFEPEPTTLQKINEEMGLLKSELSKNNELSPSMKKDLEKQITTLDNDIKEMLEIKKNGIELNILSKVYSKVAYKLFGTDDYKELLTHTWNYDHNQMKVK